VTIGRELGELRVGPALLLAKENLIPKGGAIERSGSPRQPDAAAAIARHVEGLELLRS
jgi:hypothetical protein